MNSYALRFLVRKPIHILEITAFSGVSILVIEHLPKTFFNFPKIRQFRALWLIKILCKSWVNACWTCWNSIILTFNVQQGCELRSPLETLVSNGDFFGKNLGNWSPNGLLLRSKSPYLLKFLAFHKKMNKIQPFNIQ